MSKHETIEAIPFQPPSLELLALLRELEYSSRRIAAIAAWEYSADELYGFGELTPLQVDQLLSPRRYPTLNWDSAHAAGDRGIRWHCAGRISGLMLRPSNGSRPTSTTQASSKWELERATLVWEGEGGR
jgi:hypothetical protein